MASHRKIDIQSFSKKQLQVLTWWCTGSGAEHFDAILADGAVRSGKTLSMSMSFVFWSFFRFHGTNFAVCGKTIGSTRRNLIAPLLPLLRSLGFYCREITSRNVVEITYAGRTNFFHLFGGNDSSSSSLIQGITLGGVLLDEVALMPRSFVEQALARCSLTGSTFWFNCNPESPHHWFYKEWVQKEKEKNCFYLHFTMADNPSLTKDVLSKIIATKTSIDSLDYRSITLAASDADKELVEVAEGEEIPETKIVTSENLVKLKKRGRLLVASYEALRYQKLDLFTVMLRQIGAFISRWQLRDAITVLENAGTPVTVTTAGELTYDDLVRFWNLFDPYNLTTMIASPALVEKILAMPEMRDAAAGLNFHASGKMITPLGAELIKSKHVKPNQIIGIDKSCALEMVEAAGVTTEYDKLIERQLEYAAITVTAGFSPIMKDAIKILEV